MIAGLPERDAEAAAPTAAEAIYLGAPARPWLAWLHRPARASGVGLVVVPPFGYEGVCAHRALRQLADDAAAAGAVAVRIDLDGTGDSAGDDRDPDRVGAWCASIAAAIDLARASGADRVVLAGVRLGAALACRVAESRVDVAGVVAIAPVVAGKKWLREMRALQQALGISASEDEAIGFALLPGTREAIAALELERAAVRPAPAVLVLDRDDLPGSDRWVKRLRELGAQVEQRRMPGYVEMVLDPHKAEVPEKILDATVAFATTLPALPATAVPPIATVPRVRVGDVIEEPIRIAGMHAIITRPMQVKRALLLLNAGCVRAIGPNRLYVEIARRCAADGTLVVRADLSGIGDTPARPGELDRVVYPEHGLEEVAALIAWCRRAAERVVVAGLCSGGYYAVQAGLASQPVAGIIPINPGQPGTGIDATPYQATADVERYRAAFGDLGKWKKLLAGGVDVRRLARTFAKRTRQIATSRAKELARRVGLPIPGDLGADLVQLARRGVAITYIFCAGEPGLVLFRERAGGAIEKLERHGELAVRVIDGPDHTFTPRWSHAVLVDEIAAALARV